VRDATTAALHAIRTPHTVEKSTAAAHLKTKIQGFGNFEPPTEEEPATKTAGVAGQVGDFVADSIGDMVDDFREKGAVGALKDATIDALDLVLDGVDTVWGWVAGSKGEENAQRICQPSAGMPGVPGALPPGFGPGAGGFAGPGGATQFQGPPPVTQPTSASNHYAAAFGQGVVGANNPVMLGGPQMAVPGGTPGGFGALPSSSSAAAPKAPAAEVKPPPAPMVDLLSMDEPAAPVAQAATGDLLGDMITSTPAAPASRQAPAATQDMLDL